MTVRRRLPSAHPMCMTSDPSPIGASWADVASLFLRQREREQVPCWHLLFCRLFNESAYRHLGLQFYNLFICRNPTSPGLHASESGQTFSESSFSIAQFLPNSNCNCNHFSRD